VIPGGCHHGPFGIMIFELKAEPIFGAFLVTSLGREPGT
jgi:hypothetical protein